jgi:hypothetical protein
LASVALHVLGVSVLLPVLPYMLGSHVSMSPDVHALQALFPSPFYFFDEVDCALDSIAAGRVAAFVRAQCSGSSSSRHCSKGATAGKADVANTTDDDAAAGVGETYEHDNTVSAAKVPAAGISSTASQAADEGVGRQDAAIATRVGAQYLLVSHRPVVFESASCLLGVYSNGRGSSAAVVAHF